MLTLNRLVNGARRTSQVVSLIGRLAGGLVAVVVLAGIVPMIDPAMAGAVGGHSITVTNLPTTPAFDGNPCSRPKSADPTCPTYNSCLKLLSCTGDAPDPAIVHSGATYFAFSTGTALGNSIQVLESSTLTGSYHAWPQITCFQPSTGTTPCAARYGSSAFGTSGATGLPAWTTPGAQTSPAPIFLHGRWLLYYDAVNVATGRFCLAVAKISPTAQGADGAMLEPTFVTPRGASQPLACDPPDDYEQNVGLIDPSPFVDPSSGDAYLLYKSNDGSSKAPAFIFSQKLSSNGLSFIEPPHMLLTNDTVNHPWEKTVENPSMVKVNGAYELLFSGGLWYRKGYAQAMAVCSSATGPCRQPSGPFLTSYGTLAGPAGGDFFTETDGSLFLVFAAWDNSCIGYPGPLGTKPAGCTTGSRRLFVAPVSIR